MKKMLFICMVCAAVICAFSLSTVFAVDAPADGLKLAHTKNNVVFNHSTHTTTKCEVCHHKGGDNYKCSTAGCHDDFDKKSKSETSYYNTMHKGSKDRPSCVACHKDAAGADKDKKKMLTSCKKSACHP
ncbi:MAG: cytochrome c3 family protein [Desulfovibrionaceae bacterium]